MAQESGASFRMAQVAMNMAGHYSNLTQQENAFRIAKSQAISGAIERAAQGVLSRRRFGLEKERVGALVAESGERTRALKAKTDYAATPEGIKTAKEKSDRAIQMEEADLSLKKGKVALDAANTIKSLTGSMVAGASIAYGDDGVTMDLEKTARNIAASADLNKAKTATAKKIMRGSAIKAITLSFNMNERMPPKAQFKEWMKKNGIEDPDGTIERDFAGTVLSGRLMTQLLKFQRDNERTPGDVEGDIVAVAKIDAASETYLQSRPKDGYAGPMQERGFGGGPGGGGVAGSFPAIADDLIRAVTASEGREGVNLQVGVDMLLDAQTDVRWGHLLATPSYDHPGKLEAGLGQRVIIGDEDQKERFQRLKDSPKKVMEDFAKRYKVLARRQEVATARKALSTLEDKTVASAVGEKARYDVIDKDLGTGPDIQQHIRGLTGGIESTSGTLAEDFTKWRDDYRQYLTDKEGAYNHAFRAAYPGEEIRLHSGQSDRTNQVIPPEPQKAVPKQPAAQGQSAGDSGDVRKDTAAKVVAQATPEQKRAYTEEYMLLEKAKQAGDNVRATLHRMNLRRIEVQISEGSAEGQLP